MNKIVTLLFLLFGTFHFALANECPDFEYRKLDCTNQLLENPKKYFQGFIFFTTNGETSKLRIDGGGPIRNVKIPSENFLNTGVVQNLYCKNDKLFIENISENESSLVAVRELAQIQDGYEIIGQKLISVDKTCGEEGSKKICSHTHEIVDVHRRCVLSYF